MRAEHADVIATGRKRSLAAGERQISEQHELPSGQLGQHVP